MSNEEIIRKVQAWQEGPFHPLTCGRDSSHPVLEAREQEGKVVLVCTRPRCGYVQWHIPDSILC